MVLIRDPFTGKALEDEDLIINFINNNSDKWFASKNSNIYDIDIVVVDKISKEVLFYIEVEGSNATSWDSSQKPTWPSGLMTMPIRKLKYFIEEHSIIDTFLVSNRTIEKDNFFRLYDLESNPDFTFNVIMGPQRFWIKISNSGRFFCICDKYHIVKKINSINASDKYLRNVWQNIYVTDRYGHIRDDQTMIVVGKIKTDTDLYWGQFMEFTTEPSKNLIDFLISKINE